MIVKLESGLLEGINIRSSIVLNEIFTVRLNHNNTDKSNLNANRKKIQSRMKKFYDTVKDNGERDAEIVMKLTCNGLNFDMFAGARETCDGYFKYLTKESKNQLMSYGMNKEDMEFLLAKLDNLELLYRTFINFSKQLVDTEANANLGNTINVDATTTDSDGKSVNITSSMAMVDPDCDISDEDIKHNFKIYLDFLYAAVIASKSRDENTIKDNVYKTIVPIWIEDTLRSTELENGKLAHKNSTTYNKRILPIVKETWEDGKRVLSLSVSSSIRKDVIDNPQTVYQTNYRCLAAACKKVYIQHKDSLEGMDDIGKDFFVFARYIYRMYKILGIKLFPDENKVYGDEDIRRILIEDGPGSLTSYIPTYKYLPKFYRNVQTLTEWYEKTEEDIAEEYYLQRYDGADDQIQQPVYHILNSANLSKYPQTVQSRTGSRLDNNTEIKQLLILKHLTKLIGTGNIAENLYKELYETKLERVISLEPILTVNACKNDKLGNSISMIVESIIEDNPAIYSVTGMDVSIPNYTETIIDDDALLEPMSPIVKMAMERKIEEKINKIADMYLKYYHVNEWYIPRITKRELLVKQIQATLKSYKSGKYSYKFLLGDCLVLRVNKKVEGLNGNSVIGDDIECVVMNDLRLLLDGVIYTPEIITRTQTYSPDQYNAMCNKYAGASLPVQSRDKQGNYILEEQVVCI